MTRRWMYAALATLGIAAGAQAQVSSNIQGVTLTASKGQLVTLGTPSPTTQAVAMVDNAINAYSAPFSITVAWDVNNSTTTTVKLVGYFATPAQALANGTDYIPSSRIETSVDGGTTWVPVNGAAVGGVGTTGGSVVLFTSPVTQGGNRSGSQVVTFLARINLVGAPAAASGTYSGTLVLMAICN